MTVQELYEWAKEHNAEDMEIIHPKAFGNSQIYGKPNFAMVYKNRVLLDRKEYETGQRAFEALLTTGCKIKRRDWSNWLQVRGLSNGNRELVSISLDGETEAVYQTGENLFSIDDLLAEDWEVQEWRA